MLPNAFKSFLVLFHFCLSRIKKKTKKTKQNKKTPQEWVSYAFLEPEHSDVPKPGGQDCLPICKR